MSEESAFLRTIIAAGDDLDSRMVFADWMEENSQPECASFIRDQVLVATTPTDTPERRQAAARAFKVQRRFGKRWAGPLAKHSFEYFFRGGFPDQVGMTAVKLRRHAAKLFVRRATGLSLTSAKPPSNWLAN